MRMLFDDKVSSQKKSSYQVKVAGEWNQFMDKMNMGFFDNNKMYVKSMADYRMRNIARPTPDSHPFSDMSRHKFTPTVPNIKTKLKKTTNKASSQLDSKDLTLNKNKNNQISQPELPRDQSVTSLF